MKIDRASGAPVRETWDCGCPFEGPHGPDCTLSPSIGSTVAIRKSVPFWGGRTGRVERVMLGAMGGIQVRIGMSLLWFDPWEVEDV